MTRPKSMTTPKQMPILMTIPTEILMLIAKPTSSTNKKIHKQRKTQRRLLRINTIIMRKLISGNQMEGANINTCLKWQKSKDKLS
jgi:hypothetical protein